MSVHLLRRLLTRFSGNFFELDFIDPLIFVQLLLFIIHDFFEKLMHLLG